MNTLIYSIDLRNFHTDGSINGSCISTSMLAHVLPITTHGLKAASKLPIYRLQIILINLRTCTDQTARVYLDCEFLVSQLRFQQLQRAISKFLRRTPKSVPKWGTTPRHRMGRPVPCIPLKRVSKAVNNGKCILTGTKIFELYFAGSTLAEQVLDSCIL